MREFKNRRRVDVKKRITKQTVFQERTVKNMPTIVNTPLNDDGRPKRDLERVESSGKVFRGYHRFIRAILVDERGNLYLREILQ
jgi:hypothetical protein